jgi:hypothetical protein
MNEENEEERCKICGRKIVSFHHNCPNSLDYKEIRGCPNCDDNCLHCAK